MLNFYSIVKLDKQLPNPNFDVHGIELPFRMAIASASGTGKTNSLLNLITHMFDSFHKVILCVKSIDEPLYRHLVETLPEGAIEIYEDGAIPVLEQEKGLSKLIVFDDLFLDKCQDKIKQYYIRGRKFGYSCVYISQSFYGMPKVIRDNSQYIILGRGMLERDLIEIMRCFKVCKLSKDEIKTIYRDCTAEKMNVCLFDLEHNSIRHNITQPVSEL